MSTADSLIDAVNAVFVNDIWRPYIKPNRHEKHYLLVARITSLCAAAMGLALGPLTIHVFNKQTGTLDYENCN